MRAGSCRGTGGEAPRGFIFVARRDIVPSEMDHPDCPECQRLWQAYAWAIRTHVRLDYQLRDVALEGDLERVQALAQEVYVAEWERESFREAIGFHEATGHNKATATTHL